MTYVYMLRSPSKLRRVVVLTPAGKRLIIPACGSISYLYKPSYSWGCEKRNAPFNRAIEQMEKRWDKSGVKRPMVVAQTQEETYHDIKPGARAFAYRHGRYQDGGIKHGPVLKQYPICIDDESPSGFGMIVGIVVAVEDSKGRLDKNAPLPESAKKDYDVLCEIHRLNKNKPVAV